MSDTAKILVVDDEPAVCDLLMDSLGGQGHKIEACNSGHAAVKALAVNTYDLVLLDVGLPDMDGFDAMAKIRQQWPQTLVIMITGDATIESAVEALKSGAYDFLKKPFQIVELRKTIKNALGHKRLDEARRNSEDALRASEEQFRTLVENSLIGICIVQNNKIVYLNPEQQKLYNSLPVKPLSKLIGYVHPDDVKKVIGGYQSLLSGRNKTVEEVFRFYPTEDRSKNAEIKWVQCRASIFQYKGDDAILINMVDITRSKELEHLIRLKSKMISLGRVAAGIAHEIRNPLTGINSYLYTLEDLLGLENLTDEDMAMMKQIVEQMQVASNKVESVIKRVLDFSRPGVPSMSLISVNEPLQEAIELSAVSLRKKDIKIQKTLDETVPRCYGDAQLIEQVILNLIDNAVKAMEKHDGEKKLLIRSYFKNNSIFLAVSDSGPGIPMSTKEKIFDPFFTTETDGSGIGLAISQRIINDHSGTVHVDSSKWGGAEFTIELPIDKRAAAK
jgi:PAS domain S-box-containing protein